MVFSALFPALNACPAPQDVRFLSHVVLLFLYEASLQVVQVVSFLALSLFFPAAHLCVLPHEALLAAQAVAVLVPTLNLLSAQAVHVYPSVAVSHTPARCCAAGHSLSTQPAQLLATHVRCWRRHCSYWWPHR